MKIENGEVVVQDIDDILETMIADASEYFDTRFSDSETVIIRKFYKPIAEQINRFQLNASEILQATQIDNATGVSLDLLCSLIGVSRREATRATGHVSFYREQPSDVRDYSISSGTYVKTSGENQLSFRTTESAILEEGEIEVEVPIRSVEKGSEQNISSQQIEIIREPIAGIDGVINYEPTSGGSDIEKDDSLRERAKSNLSEGSASTVNSLITSVQTVPNVRNVQIFKNENEEYGTMPGWEMVVHGGSNQKIGQKLVNTMAAGDTAYGGNLGEKVTVDAELENGQTWEISFSRPNEKDIYIEVSIEVTDEYEGDEEVLKSVINYIGGIGTDGNINFGEISVGDDVIYGEIEFAIRTVDGVYDVTNLEVDTASPPNGTSNINIEDFEIATLDANENIEISTTEI